MPTRMGQGYVFEASQPEQDEYDIPRHLLGPGPQDIYDVPPVRGLLPSQYSQEVSVGTGVEAAWTGPAQGAEPSWPSPGQDGPGVGAVECLLFSSPQVARAPVSLHLFCPQVYDTPPMAVKGPNGRDPSLDVYDVPPSVEKGLPPSSHRAVSSRGVPGPHGLRQDSARFWL